MLEDARTAFGRAVEYHLSQRGRGAETSLAIDLGISQGHLNKIKKGVKGASLELGLSVARALGTSIEEMLSLGHGLLSGDPQAAILPPASDSVLIPFPIRRAHRPLDTSDPEPWIADALGQAWAVLESGTKTADALLLNIQEFYEKVSPPQGRRPKTRGAMAAGVGTREGAHRRVVNGE